MTYQGYSIEIYVDSKVTMTTYQGNCIDICVDYKVR